jgi:3-isopropylmalate/(R)-2-methylmalate dehydratase small subunit
MIKGRAFKYGDNVDTDVIIPARYLNITDKAELASHCMEDIDGDFVKMVKPGDIIAAGKNFGCGSSREHAPLVIKLSGIKCIIAESFARIFFRNAINIGLSILECADAARDMENGDRVEADIKTGRITNITKGRTYQAESFPEFMQDIMKAGGLINYVRERGTGL